MTELVVLCIDDEREVLDALVRDLAPLADAVRIEVASDADDARAAVSELLAARERLAVVLCDHMMPGTSGVEYLVELTRDPATRPARKMLVTGQAGLADTITAVNEAGLDQYIAKPWDADELRRTVRRHLTDYVIDEVDDVLPFVRHLDGQRLLEAHRDRGTGDR